MSRRALVRKCRRPITSATFIVSSTAFLLVVFFCACQCWVRLPSAPDTPCAKRGGDALELRDGVVRPAPRACVRRDDCPGLRRSAIVAAAACLSPLFLLRSASAKVITRKTDSLQEEAGLAGQSNRDVEKYADLGQGLKAVKLDVPKIDDTDPEASRQVKQGDQVTVDLIGYLSGYNGLTFVRTQDKSGYSEAPVTFTVGKGAVIPGLERGVVGMVKGEKRRLVIPGSLGYPRPLSEEDFGKPGTLPNPMLSAPGSGEPWELRNRLLNGVINNNNRDDTLVMDVKMKRIN